WWLRADRPRALDSLGDVEHRSPGLIRAPGSPMRSLGILLVIATFNLAQALLQLFEGMDQQRFLAVLSEVAAVG
ncbi:MAG: hypothetical protein ACKOZT_01330, partial [Cyanobium sp.]